MDAWNSGQLDLCTATKEDFDNFIEETHNTYN
jgi:hypothetical protein